MTQTSKYSTDVENLTISENVPTWSRERSSDELSSFVERHIGLVGELDPAEYAVAL